MCADNAKLLDQCFESLTSGRLDPPCVSSLQHWWAPQRERAASLIDSLDQSPVATWSDRIRAHRAHRHRWYDFLANSATLEEFASFMLENRAFPTFLPLAQRALEAQICDAGRSALRRNIDDEQVPVPHAELMRRLMGALRARAGDGLSPDLHPDLVDRTLVYYYGYYVDVWALVGAMYVTEAVAAQRLKDMDDGLRRLDFGPYELEFIRVHLCCDEDHARDWSEGVITPTLALKPSLRGAITAGIAVSLETSARYLDHLVARAGRNGSRSAATRDAAEQR